jgi:hypothetical protein
MFGDSHAFSSFSVNDLAAAKRFYGDTLGLKVDEQPEGLGLQLPTVGESFSIPRRTTSLPLSPSSTSRSTTSRRLSTSSPERGLPSRGIRIPMRRGSTVAWVPTSPGSRIPPATSYRCSRAARAIAVAFG